MWTGGRARRITSTSRSRACAIRTITASMKQVLERRFAHFLAGDAGFSDRPDALLIDGGVEHANVALNVLRELSIDIPVFGMVKDDRHRTRALVTPDGQEIGNFTPFPAVFAFIGGIQEEVHRFAITYHRLLRSKRMRESELEKIPGIGEKRQSAPSEKIQISYGCEKRDPAAALRGTLREAGGGGLCVFPRRKGYGRSMRVITGSARGVRLQAPKGMDTPPDARSGQGRHFFRHPVRGGGAARARSVRWLRPDGH